MIMPMARLVVTATQLPELEFVTMVPAHVPPRGVGEHALGLETRPHVCDTAHQPQLGTSDKQLVCVLVKRPDASWKHVSKTATPTLLPCQAMLAVFA